MSNRAAEEAYERSRAEHQAVLDSSAELNRIADGIEELNSSLSYIATILATIADRLEPKGLVR